MFDGSDDDADFMETEAAEAADEDYKDLIEEHEEEVKTRKTSRKTNAIDDDGDSDDGAGGDVDMDDLGMSDFFVSFGDRN